MSKCQRLRRLPPYTLQIQSHSFILFMTELPLNASKLREPQNVVLHLSMRKLISDTVVIVVNYDARADRQYRPRRQIYLRFQIPGERVIRVDDLGLQLGSIPVGNNFDSRAFIVDFRPMALLPNSCRILTI